MAFAITASNARAQGTVQFRRRVVINVQAGAGREQSEEVILPVSGLQNNFIADMLPTRRVYRDEQNSVETLACLWPALFVYRILGLFPISKQGNHLRVPSSFFSLYWLPTFLLIICQFIYFVNYILKLSKLSAEGLDSSIESGLHFICVWHTFTNTVISIWKMKLLPQLLKMCKDAEAVCQKYGAEVVPGLARDCLVLFVILESAHLLSMAMHFSASAIQSNVTSVSEYLDLLNNEHFRSTSAAFYTGLLISVSEIYAYTGLNFGDVLLCLLPLILTRYFTRLHAVLTDGERNSDVLESLRQGHLELCRMVQVCDDIFSPLFLATYIANVVYLFVRLYLSFQYDLQSPNAFVKIESIFASLYLLFGRILLPSFLAAQLNEKVQDGWTIIRDWKPSLRGPDRESKIVATRRFMLQTGTSIGMSGWGYFVVNKNSIANVVSVLFTYEIVIAQLQISANTTMEN